MRVPPLREPIEDVVRDEIDDVSRRWLAAAKVLGRNPAAAMPCPVCGEGILQGQGIRYEADPSRFSRVLRCPKCGASESIDRLKL